MGRFSSLSLTCTLQLFQCKCKSNLVSHSSERKCTHSLFKAHPHMFSRHLRESIRTPVLQLHCTDVSERATSCFSSPVMQQNCPLGAGSGPESAADRPTLMIPIWSSFKDCAPIRLGLMDQQAPPLVGGSRCINHRLT